MALGKLKCDSIENEGGSSIDVSDLVTLDSGKAPKASPTFTGTVTLPATTALAGQASDITIIDNNATALEIKEGSNAYMTFDTTDTSEKVSVQKAFDCDSTLNVDGVSTMNDHLNLTAQKELRLQDSSGGQYVAIKAPATVGSNVTLTFPADDGNADEVLTTNGSGVLSWAAASGGKVLGSAVFTNFTRTAFSARTAFTTIFTISYNKQSSTSKLYVWGQTQGFGQNSGGTIYQMRYAGGTLVDGAGSFTYPGGNYGNLICWAGVISSTSTGSNNIEVGHSGAGNNHAQSLIHPQESDHGDFTNGEAGTHILILEVEA